VTQNFKKPIGVFDSGIGGLTVVSEIIKRLPNEDIVYFGDTARVPYGTKSPEIIRQFALEISLFLINQNVKMIVVACNTVSSVALDDISKKFDLPLVGGKYYDGEKAREYMVISEKLSVPLVGVIKPGVRGALQVTKNKKIGVIGTKVTISSEAYTKALKSIDNNLEIFSQACPLFVPLVEEGWMDKNATFLIAEEYLSELKSVGVDTLILGCTHYPLLKLTLSKIMGEHTRLVDSAFETAVEVEKILKENNLINSENKNPNYKFFVSDIPYKFREIGERFLGRELTNVARIDVEGPEWKKSFEI
jgi:glutamate racemase